MQASDRVQVRSWRNSPQVAAYMYRDDPITPEVHAAWFAAALDDPARCYWIVGLDGRDIGLANLYAISEPDRRCSWAFYLAADDLRGQGIGSAVEYLVLEQVFEVRNFNRLCCEVLAENEPVIRLHENHGFRREGVLRQHICKDGRFLDVVLLALLRPDWDSKKDSLREKIAARGIDIRTVE